MRRGDPSFELHATPCRNSNSTTGSLTALPRMVQPPMSSAALLSASRFCLLLGAGFLAAAPLATAEAGVFTVSDSDFANFGTNYSLNSFASGNGGTQTPLQQPSAGNPGSFLQITNNINAAPASGQSIANIFVIQLGSGYTPSVSGAITTIDFSMNLIRLFQSQPGLAVNASPAVRQNGRFYLVPGTFITGATVWTPFSQTGFTANDFKEAINDPTGASFFNSGSTPNFASGSAIEFGWAYPTGGAPGSPGFTTIAGFDNWVTTVNTVTAVPEPGTYAVGAFALLTGLWQLRRRFAVRTTQA